ncbi:MAG: HAD-IB family hydrolase [Lentisphaeria bacterium]|nr:HAD-IB family hydrolase [Lentisphaeria bacterium]
MSPTVYFFDMDHTLINNDCDVSWKDFLIAHGLAPEDDRREAETFYDQYKRGQLDVPAFMRFQLREFIGRTPGEMAGLCQQHFEEIVRSAIYPAARLEVAKALASGAPVVLLTATNDVIARPLADHLGIATVEATRLAVVDGRFTGDIQGIYCVGEGKLAHARDYCDHQAVDVSTACYYGDAVSDIPLLRAVGYPVVCNPGPELARAAHDNNWPVKRF